MKRKPRPRTCEAEGCSVKFIPARPFVTWCSVDCGVKVAEQRKAKKERKEWKARKDALRPIQYWLKRAECAVNAYVRALEEGEGCISCGTHTADQYHAGHFVPVGRSASIRFDYANIHLQCRQCNIHKGGNLTEYEIRLVAKIGAAEVERLKNAPRAKKWTREELQEIEKKAKADLRALIAGRERKAA